MQVSFRERAGVIYNTARALHAERTNARPFSLILQFARIRALYARVIHFQKRQTRNARRLAVLELSFLKIFTFFFQFFFAFFFLKIIRNSVLNIFFISFFYTFLFITTFFKLYFNHYNYFLPFVIAYKYLISH